MSHSFWTINGHLQHRTDNELILRTSIVCVSNADYILLPFAVDHTAMFLPCATYQNFFTFYYITNFSKNFSAMAMEHVPQCDLVTHWHSQWTSTLTMNYSFILALYCPKTIKSEQHFLEMVQKIKISYHVFSLWNTTEFTPSECNSINRFAMLLYCVS